MVAMENSLSAQIVSNIFKNWEIGGNENAHRQVQISIFAQNFELICKIKSSFLTLADSMPT